MQSGWRFLAADTSINRARQDLPSPKRESSRLMVLSVATLLVFEKLWPPREAFLFRLPFLQALCCRWSPAEGPSARTKLHAIVCRMSPQKKKGQISKSYNLNLTRCLTSKDVLQSTPFERMTIRRERDLASNPSEFSSATNRTDVRPEELCAWRKMRMSTGPTTTTTTRESCPQDEEFLRLALVSWPTQRNATGLNNVVRLLLLLRGKWCLQQESALSRIWNSGS